MSSAAAGGKSQSGSDLTAFAQEFVPGEGRVGAAAAGGRGHTNGRGAEEDFSGSSGGPMARRGVESPAPAVQKMVQVVRGGTIYFVPESEALGADEPEGPEAYVVEEEEDDGGFLWAHESTALPAPQRRTMHR